MEVLTTEKATSWPERLADLEVNEELRADYDKRKTVRDAISKVFLKKGMKFSTEKKVENGDKILLVKRVK